MSGLTTISKPLIHFGAESVGLWVVFLLNSEETLGLKS